MDVKKEALQFPEVWEDDTRMNVLFSPFRPKSINPIDWDSKLKFWETLIRQFCLQLRQPAFSLEILQKAFTRKGKTPSCLESVLEEMKRSGAIVEAEGYKNYSLASESLAAWTARLLIKAPAQWAFSLITTPFSIKSDSKTISYVDVSAVKKLSSEFLANMPEKTKGRLVDMKIIMQMNNITDEDTLKIILRPLIEEKKAAVVITPNGTLIKFVRSDGKVTSITEIDLGVYELEKTEEQLMDHIETLEEEKEAVLKEVKNCLASKRRQTAKSWLRRKKELEKYIDKRASALENVRCLLDKIHQTESDSLVLDAYKQGVAALKETFRTTGLTEERAEKTMDELEDVLDVHNEIETTLARSLDPEADSILESELAEFLIDTAPDVPPTDFSSANTGDSGFIIESPEHKINSLPNPLLLPDVPDPLPSSLNLPDVPEPTIDDILEARIKALSM